MKGLAAALIFALWMPLSVQGRSATDFETAWEEFQRLTDPLIESNRRATPEAQERIFAFERNWLSVMSEEQILAFQSRVGQLGARIRGQILRPKPGVSFWMREPSRLHQYRSTPELIREVDYLGVGAGLAGAGAMPELLAWANARGESVAWVDAQGVGEGASGQNGGNFATWSERFNGVTIDGKSLDGESQGLEMERYIFLKRAHPHLDERTLQRLAHESAILQMRNGVANAELLKDSVQKFGIEDAYVSDAGWFRLADSHEDEAHLSREMELARSLGIDVEWWSAGRIENELGIPARFGGRLVKGFGNYHPYKFVTGVFEWGLRNGLKLYTQTRVLSIHSDVAQDAPVVVQTDQGPVRVRKKVLVFTDSYTDFIPGLKGIIQPFQSRILTFDHVPNTLKGLSLTRHAGDWYTNGPKSTWYTDENGELRMMLLIGGGPDTPAPDPWNLELNPEHYDVLFRQANESLPFLNGRAPASLSQGPFGFTPDGMAVADELQGSRVIGAVGSQGYGGTQSALLGKVTAQRITKAGDELAHILKQHAPLEHMGLKRFDRFNCEANVLRIR